MFVYPFISSQLPRDQIKDTMKHSTVDCSCYAWEMGVYLDMLCVGDVGVCRYVVRGRWGVCRCVVRARWGCM